MFKNCFTICVDMDDTIENLLEAWLKYLNIKYNLNVKLNDVTEWDMRKIYPTLSEDQIFEPLYIRDFWKTVTPKPDAQYFLEKLYNENQKIYICTCSHYKTVLIKYEEIIAKYFPFIDWRHIIIMHDKQMIKCDILIDDGPHNLINGEYHKILIDAPHNKSFKNEENNILRVFSWKEIYDLIKNLDCIYSSNK